MSPRFMLMRLLSVALAFAAASCARGFERDYGALYRSAKRVQASTDVGVNYQRFGDIAQEFAAEVAIASDRATTEKERDLVKAFARVLEAYKDSRTFWDAKIESAKLNIPDGDVLNAGEVTRIAKAYGLSKGTSDLGIAGDSVPLIWREADKRLERAVALYYGRPVPHSSPNPSPSFK